MRRISNQMLFGGIIIIWGLLLLVSNIFDVNYWAICWPAFFVILGLWLIFRPQLEDRFPNTHLLLIGDHRLKGDWQVVDREYWAFIGDYKLDMQQATLASGETHLRFSGFVQDIKLITPEDIGISVSSTGFVNEASIYGEKKNSFLLPFEFTSPNFSSAERKLRIECFGFVSTLKIRTPET